MKDSDGLGIRCGLGFECKPGDTAGIGKRFRGLVVEATKALSFALRHETGLGVLCTHTPKYIMC